MKNWLPQKTIVLSTRLLVAACLLLYLGGVSFVFWQIKDIEEYYKSIESRSSQTERTRMLKALVENNKEDIQTLRQFFIKKGDEVKFIEQIEAVAKTSNIQFEIASIEVDKERADNFKEEVSVQMNIEGAWSNLNRFIQSLGKMPFGLTIGNLNLDKKTAGVWTGSVQFVVYREK